MRKFFLFVLFLTFCTASFSQETTENSPITNSQATKQIRKKFFNISYVQEKLQFPVFDNLDAQNFELKNDWGVSITRGRTYMLHRKPIGRVLSFGLDVSFLDLSYSMYSTSMQDFGNSESNPDNGGYDPNEGDYPIYPYYEYDPMYGDENSEVKMHKIDYGFMLGGSINLNPGKRVMVSAYFRYAPTFSALYCDSSFLGNYSSQFRSGVSLSYGVIGLGIEARWGNCKYKSFTGDLDFGDRKIDMKGYRAYIQFRW